VEQPGEGFGFFGALASRLVQLKGGLGGSARIVGPPDMDEEVDQAESDYEELVPQQVRRHEDVPSHDGARRRLYRIHPLTNYPLVVGTPPPYVYTPIINAFTSLIKRIIFSFLL
jgi:hypothetical protein